MPANGAEATPEMEDDGETVFVLVAIAVTAPVLVVAKTSEPSEAIAMPCGEFTLGDAITVGLAPVLMAWTKFPPGQV